MSLLGRLSPDADIHRCTDSSRRHYRQLQHYRREGEHWDEFQFLYENLSILDSKAASLLQFNSILLAVVAIFFTQTDGAARWVYLVDLALNIVSCWLCLRVVWVSWSSTEDLSDPGRHGVNLVAVRDLRTRLYRKAWWLAAVSLLGLLVGIAVPLVPAWTLIIAVAATATWTLIALHRERPIGTPEEAPSGSGGRACPVSGEPLVHEIVLGVHVEWSPCGLWLDRGELNLITEAARRDVGALERLAVRVKAVIVPGTGHPDPQDSDRKVGSCPAPPAGNRCGSPPTPACRSIAVSMGSGSTPESWT